LSNKRFYSPEKKREEKKTKEEKETKEKKEEEKRKKKGAVLCVSVLILEVCCDFPLCPGSRL
jgi:Ca2+/H+ antiporter